MTRHLKRISLAVVAVVILAAAGGYLWLRTSEKFNVTLPEYQPPAEIVYLDQGWTPEQRTRFYHTPQGTRLLRYEWFLALEQPCLSLSACQPLADPEYLARFGFIADAADPTWNPDALPVGFARQADFHDPETGETYAVVGLTCAACHTGELTYDNHTIRIDGGPARIETVAFQKAIGLSLAFTKLIPFRYARFEKKLLGENASAEAKAALKKNFDALLDDARPELDAVERMQTYKTASGFGRTDALTRIGNQVFAADMRMFDNLAAANSPVRFPQIWDASWLTWVQYNSSIADPLVRNIGEALGVRAIAKLYGPDATKFANSVHLEGLRDIENLLSGPAPYQGLRSPKWPADFPPLDPAKVARGEALYKEHCQACHLPPLAELEADLASPSPQYWIKSGGRSFLRVKEVPIDYVGTDPHQAADFLNRKVDATALKFGIISVGEGLEKVTNAVATRFFTEHNIPPDQQLMWRGYRDPNAPAVRALAVYRPRPLNGIWAVAPYLHNGSVPNLWEMLSPEPRSEKFWVGTKQYDPIRVGFQPGVLPGAFELDTTQPGSSNSGHRFQNGPRGKGIIGPELPADDRWAIIEFLKSM